MNDVRRDIFFSRGGGGRPDLLLFLAAQTQRLGEGLKQMTNGRRRFKMRKSLGKMAKRWRCQRFVFKLLAARNKIFLLEQERERGFQRMGSVPKYTSVPAKFVVSSKV
jgi:hypothetical protein